MEYVRGSDDFKKLVAGSKYAKNENFVPGEKGPVLFQDHGDSVFSTNIKIREIK